MTDVTDLTDLGDARAVAARLRAERRPFVAATVVRAERPTSARAGDTALILADGTVIGFVGGECAQASVQAQALAALAVGEPRLLRISPDAPADAGVDLGREVIPEAGAVTVHNPCLSGGTLEVFLEPAVPPGLALVHGDAPIARALRELAGWLGYDVRPWDDEVGELLPDAAAVIVASHGSEEKAVLEAALAAGVPYIGLVASPRRAAGVVGALDVSDDDRVRISTPAGFDIGARTPQEVALSILAEAVDRRPRPEGSGSGTSASEASGLDAPGLDAPGLDAPGLDVTTAQQATEATAVDPICGMAVAAIDSTRHLDHEGVRYWFCGSGCEDAFRADPAGAPHQ